MELIQSIIFVFINTAVVKCFSTNTVVVIAAIAIMKWFLK